MPLLKYFLGLILLLSIMSCGKKDIHDYYFPLKKLKDAPKVYEYKYTSQDTSFNLYWYYQTQISSDSVLFVGTCYSPSFEILLMTIESKETNGMLLKDLKYFSTDTMGRALTKKAIIKAGAAFPFAVTDSNGVFVSNYTIVDPKDSTHTTTVTRNRRYLRDTTITFQGKTIPAIIFNLKEEQVEHDNKLGGWQHIFSIDEIYAQNIGLYETKRYISSSEIFIGRLEKIITMDELEAMSKH